MAYPQEQFVKTKLLPESFIDRRRVTAYEKTLLYQLEVLKKTGRYDAFKLQWHPSYGDPPDVWPVPNHLFWDSDVAKWIEGACYFLEAQRQPLIERAINELVQMIRSAQQPDGYINIHFTVVEPDKRFTNLRDLHELYNAGHLIEAALAHQHLFNNQDLVEPILKYVDLLSKKFGPQDSKSHGYPGHPEIELSLLRLSQRTEDRTILDLGRYFILERGNPSGQKGKHFYKAEAEARGDDPLKRPAYYPEPECLWYYQAHKPLLEQETIEGHSVRAMYLLTAASDLVRLDSCATGDLRSAVSRLWENMAQKKMYVTGGIGAVKQYEGFGQDYYLPQGTDEGGCYAETCAAIGVMMLAQRILQYDLDRKYSDIMELCFYNAVLTAMSLDGQRFTYVNQLASSDVDLSRREEWFTCSCCPPNILRLLGQIGGYIYDQQRSREGGSLDVHVHMYNSSTYAVEHEGNKSLLKQETDWPWDGNIKFTIEEPLENLQLKLRIPGWATSWQLNPPISDAKVEKGYLIVPPAYIKSHSTFTLTIPLTPRLITLHPDTNQDTLTLARGPIIYCVEDFDNPWVTDHFKSVQLDPKCEIKETSLKDEGSGETYVGLSVENGASQLDLNQSAEAIDKDMPFLDAKSLDRMRGEAEIVPELKFVPYYFRANRDGKGHMRVGLKRWIR